jgi:signal peptidase I
MSWATHAIEALQRGEAVLIRPRGHSMSGKVNDGDLVTVRPAEPVDLMVGAIVLVRVRGTDYLHLIKAVDGDRYQIGNNRGGVNGWVRAPAIYGVATKVEPYSAERKRQGVSTDAANINPVG